MERDARGFLWDVLERADAISRLIADRPRDDYIADGLRKAAVERHFEIIGEALNQLSKISPDVAARIPELGQAVALRNRLIHAYPLVDHALLWRIATEDLPALRSSVAELLTAMDRDAP
jgi:uncharacterized protein with HEPN domain